MTTSLGMPRRNKPWLTSLGRVWLRLWGWHFAGALPEIPRFIIVVAPHTSNWDFPLGVAAMFSLDLRIHWFGKDTLFRPPLGWLFRALDGRPVRRAQHEGVVREVAEVIRSEPQFLLALAPEGTRKPVTKWRTGFYHIAAAAEIPVVPVWFDWEAHEIGIGPPMMPTGDIQKDLAHLQSYYRRGMARNPGGFSVIPAGVSSVATGAADA